MNTLFFICFIFLFTGCQSFGQLKIIADLPSSLDENSGIAMFADSTAWLIEDRGNGDNIFQIDLSGKVLKKLEVKNAKNFDWEDLTKDSAGNLYIGDFGNNQNSRKNLVIYKLPNPESEPGQKIDAQKIKFKYPEQKKFPPKKKNRIYDAEAFFHFGDSFYIFTKNRADPFTGETTIYRVPEKKGKHIAERIGTLKTCTDRDFCQITAADISPDGKKIVLLSYGKLWIITDFSLEALAKGSIKEIDLGVRTQLEAVCFTDNKTLLLSDEKRDGTGGNLYSYTLSDFN